MLRFRSLIFALFVAAPLSGAASIAAQTGYYNTDRGRPVQIEDAYATERYAFELKIAPVRLDRTSGGTYRWGVEPEIAFGLLPRTHIEVGLPVAWNDAAGPTKAGIGGLDLSLFHNLNTETTTMPALGLRADLLAPVGNLAADAWYASFTAIATRTVSWARFHLNGQYTAGDEISPSGANAGSVEVTRWMAGLAIDKTLPLSALLVTVEGFASKPLTVAPSDVEFTTGAGIRYQVSPAFAVDGGAGRRLTGDQQGWYGTFGTAYAFGLRSLFPSGR